MNYFRLGAVVTGAFIILSLILVPFFVEKIAPGHVGVVYKPGNGVQSETLPEGWHVVSPFDKITEYPIRLQTYGVADQTFATSDGKNVTMDFSYNLKVDPTKVVAIFKEFGPITVDDIAEGYLKSRLYDAGRQSISRVDILQLFGEKSGEVAINIQDNYKEDVIKYGFIIDDLAMGAPKPDAKTQEAIDARVAAAQQLDRTKTELEIAKMEAEKKRETARGEADSQLIRAQGEAESNKELQQSITPQLIQYTIANKWDGKQPLVTGEGGQIIQLPLPQNNK